jgi:hypothetical protein
MAKFNLKSFLEESHIAIESSDKDNLEYLAAKFDSFLHTCKLSIVDQCQTYMENSKLYLQSPDLQEFIDSLFVNFEK